MTIMFQTLICLLGGYNMIFFNRLFLSPLEQFRLQLLYPLRLHIGDLCLDFSLTVSFAYLVGALLLCKRVTKLRRLYIWSGSVWQGVVENIYKFVFSIIKQQSGAKGLQYFPFIYTLFWYVLLLNIVGLFPYSFTNTSQIAITGTLGLSVIVGIVILGFYCKGLNFLKIFIPSNVPTIIFPFLVVIEIVSFCIRPVSLSLRLCANMMAGHTLLNIICSFFVSLFYYKNILSWVVLILLLAIGVLEFGIAILQAYVFTMLSCVYLNDAIGEVGH